MAEEKKQSVASDEISLKELILKLKEWFRYLRSKWLIILIAAIIGGILGLAYSLYKKPVYVATLTFALEEKSSGSALGAYAGLASQFGIDLGGGSGGMFSGDNIMELMKSRRMVSKAFLSGINVNGKEKSLADDYIDFNHFRDSWKKSSKVPEDIVFPLNANPDSLSYIQDSLMGGFYNSVIKNNLTVDKPNTKLSIIAVTCKSPNELFAKYFTEALVKNVSAFYIQTKTGSAVANMQIIQDRLDSVKRAFNTALYGAAISTDQNLNPARAVVSVPGLKNQAEAKILGTEYGELVKNLELAKMTLLRETPLVQVIDKPILPLKVDKLGKIKAILLGSFILAGLIIIILSVRKLLDEILI